MSKPASNGETIRSAAVVCVAGRGENGLAIVRALGRIGVTVYVLGFTGDMNLAATSKYCRRAISVPRGDSDALLAKLEELASLRNEKPVLYFDNDEMMAILAGAACALADRYIFTVPLERLGGWLSKRNQQDLAVGAGLRVPQCWFPTSWEDLDEIERGNPVRLLAKPLEVSDAGSRPFKIVVSEESRTLGEILKARGVESPDGLIVQEYIEGGTENIFVSLAYFGSHGQSPLVATGIKVRQNKPEGGVMTVGQARDVPAVRELTLAYARHLDYRGILGVEFKRASNQGEYVFIEASFRTELFHSLGWKSGANLPVLAYRDLAEHSVERVLYDSAADHYWINLRADLKSLLSAKQRLGKLAFAKPYLSRKEWAVFASDDLGPWARSIVSLGRPYLGRLRARLIARLRKPAAQSRVS